MKLSLHRYHDDDDPPCKMCGEEVDISVNALFGDVHMLPSTDATVCRVSRFTVNIHE